MTSERRNDGRARGKARWRGGPRRAPSRARVVRGLKAGFGVESREPVYVLYKCGERKEREREAGE